MGYKDVCEAGKIVELEILEMNAQEDTKRVYSLWCYIVWPFNV